MRNLSRNELRPTWPKLEPVQHDPFAPVALVPVEHDPWQHTAEPVHHDPFEKPKTGAAK